VDGIDKRGEEFDKRVEKLNLIIKSGFVEMHDSFSAVFVKIKVR